MFNRDEYFSRIGYKEQPDISVKTLKDIHTAQVFSIPFENLDIHDTKNDLNPNSFIKLDELSLFKKLVTEKRGGYCHENNELLAIVLIQLGFQVERLAARVLTAPNLPRGHKLLLVTIDNQRWIADVGFGGYGLFEPIPLTVDKEVTQYNDKFKITKEDDIFILQILDKDTWKKLYEFTLEVFKAIDFEQMSYNVSHNPDSIFVKNRICVIPRPEGRIILNNHHLKIIYNNKITNNYIKNDEEYRSTLKSYFGINLTDEVNLREMKKDTTISNIPNISDHCFGYFTKAILISGIAIGTAYVSDKLIKNISAI